MGKWIDNKYVEDAEGDARCGFSRSYFCGYENKTEFCKNNNMTRTTLEKILIMLKQQFKDITLENILQEQVKLSPQAVQLTQIEDAEEKKEEKKEEKDDKRKNNGRTPQPFLGYSSLTEFCKKKHTFIPTVKKIIQQLNEQGIEITEENIFKQRDLNRRHTQAFRKDRANTNIKQISTVLETEIANSELQEGWEPLVKIEEKEEVKKDDDMIKQYEVKEMLKINEEKKVGDQVVVPPKVLEAWMNSHIERRIQEGINNGKVTKAFELFNVISSSITLSLAGLIIGFAVCCVLGAKLGLLRITISI